MSQVPKTPRIEVPVEQRLKLLNETDREILVQVLAKWPAIMHAIQDAEDVGLDMTQHRAQHEAAGAAAQMLLQKHFPPVVPASE